MQSARFISDRCSKWPYRRGDFQGQLLLLCGRSGGGRLQAGWTATTYLCLYWGRRYVSRVRLDDFSIDMYSKGTTCSRLIYDYQVCPSVNAFRNMCLFAFFPHVFLHKSLWIKQPEALFTCAASYHPVTLFTDQGSCRAEISSPNTRRWGFKTSHLNLFQPGCCSNMVL